MDPPVGPAGALAESISEDFPDWPAFRDPDGRSLPMLLLHATGAANLCAAVDLLAGHDGRVGFRAVRAVRDARDHAHRSLWPYLMRAAAASEVTSQTCGALRQAKWDLLSESPARPALEPLGHGIVAGLQSIEPVVPPFALPAYTALPMGHNLADCLRQGLRTFDTPWSADAAQPWLAGWEGCPDGIAAVHRTARSARLGLSVVGLWLVAMAPAATGCVATLPRAQRETFLNIAFLDRLLLRQPPQATAATATASIMPWLAPDVTLWQVTRRALAARSQGLAAWMSPSLSPDVHAALAGCREHLAALNGAADTARVLAAGATRRARVRA